MSQMQNKPSIVDICKKALNLNGWAFYEMQDSFTQLNKRYWYSIVKYNPKSDKTQCICIYNKRSLINYCYKKGYTSYNPCEISKNHTFQKNTFSRTSLNGDHRKTVSVLKYIKQ